MGVNAQVFLILLCIFVLCIPGHGVYAFGAGNIPGSVLSRFTSKDRADRIRSFAYMEGRAFRHGDIVRCYYIFVSFI